MCNIWQSEDHDELSPLEYCKLPRSLDTINISGGEPFLRTDLREVVSAIHKAAPKARFVFSTNGYLTDRIVSEVSEMREIHPKIGVGVSIDGLETVHDVVRGVSGMYSRAVETVRRLKEIGVTDLRIAMTILPENVQETQAVFRLAGDLGVEFTATVAHNSDIYFRKDDNVEISGVCHLNRTLRPIIRSQLMSTHIKDWYRVQRSREFAVLQRRQFIMIL